MFCEQCVFQGRDRLPDRLQLSQTSPFRQRDGDRLHHFWSIALLPKLSAHTHTLTDTLSHTHTNSHTHTHTHSQTHTHSHKHTHTLTHTLTCFPLRGLAFHRPPGKITPILLLPESDREPFSCVSFFHAFVLFMSFSFLLLCFCSPPPPTRDCTQMVANANALAGGTHTHTHTHTCRQAHTVHAHTHTHRTSVLNRRHI